MKRVAKVTSPKKTDVVDVAQRMFLAVEYTSKNHVEDHKHWKEQLAKLDGLVKKLESSIGSDQSPNKAELGKQFTEAAGISAKIDKEIEKARTQLHKEQQSFEKTLVVPFSNGEFNHLETEQKNSVTATIAAITALLQEARTKLDTVIALATDYSARLSRLESPVNKVVLSEQIDETIKLNERLNERLELILQCAGTLGQNLTTSSNANGSSSASGSSTTNPKLFNLPETESKLLTLFQAHVKGQEKLSKAKDQVHSTAEAFAKLSI
jgi:hypothetical protein